MKTALTCLLLLALAAPLFAGEAEVANAKKFLDTQTAIDETALGEQKLAFRVLGVSVGTITLKIEAGEFEGAKCYVLTTTGAFELGVKNTLSSKAYFAPNLSLLSAESAETEGGKTSEHAVYTVKDGVITAKIQKPTDDDESMRDKTYQIKAIPGLLLAGGEMLVSVLLPREAGKKYEFTRWSSEADENFAFSVDAVGTEELNGKATFRFNELGKKYLKDEMGDMIISDVESTLWFDGRKLVRMIAPEGFELTSGEGPRRTPITREVVEKRDDKIATAAGFYLAANEQDRPLLEALLNEEKIVRKSLDVNPMTEGLSNEEKDALAKQYASTVFDQILGAEKSDEDKLRDVAVAKLLLHVENFEVIEMDGKQIVRFTKDARKFAEDVSFAVAQDAEQKWEIVEIISGGSMTPEEQRQAVADAMKAAVEALDADAAMALFHADEQENAEKRIGKGFREMKAEGTKVTSKVPTIEEKEGKFFATFVMTVEAKDGSKEEDTKTLSLIEKDGKWYLSFTK